MARQLRTFKEGETVQLALHSVSRRDPWIVEAILVGREGEGMEEKLYFQDKGDLRNSRWEVYRFKGHWAWGSSGSRLTVHDPDAPPRKPRVSRAAREAATTLDTKVDSEKPVNSTAPKTRKPTVRRTRKAAAPATAS